MKFKKVLALLLVLAMCFSMVPTYAFADFEDDMIEIVEENNEEPADEPAAEEDAAPVEEPADDPADAPADDPAEDNAEENVYFEETEDYESSVINAIIYKPNGTPVGYETLAEAIFEAGTDKVGGETEIRIMTDIAEDVEINKEVFIHPNDEAKLTGDITIEKGANAHIVGLTIVGDITVNDGFARFVMCDIDGTMTINGGDVALGGNNMKHKAISIIVNDGWLTVPDVIESDEGDEIAVYGGEYNVVQGYVPGDVRSGWYSTIDKILVADWYVARGWDLNNPVGYWDVMPSDDWLEASTAAMVGWGVTRYYYADLAEAFDATVPDGQQPWEHVTISPDYEIPAGFSYELDVEQELIIANNEAAEGIEVLLDAPAGYVIDKKPLLEKPQEEESENNPVWAYCYFCTMPKAEVVSDDGTSKYFATFAEAVEDAAGDEDKTVYVYVQPDKEKDIGILEEGREFVTVVVPVAEDPDKQITVQVKTEDDGYGILCNETPIEGSTILYFEWVKKVAMIGENTYATLADAVEAAVPATASTPGSVIELLGNTTIDSTIVLDKAGVIINSSNGNDYTVKASGKAASLEPMFSVTADNVTIGNITLDSNKIAKTVLSVDAAGFELSNATILNTAAKGVAMVVASNADALVTDSLTVNAAKNAADIFQVEGTLDFNVNEFTLNDNRENSTTPVILIDGEGAVTGDPDVNYNGNDNSCKFAMVIGEGHQGFEPLLSPKIATPTVYKFQYNKGTGDEEVNIYYSSFAAAAEVAVSSEAYKNGRIILHAVPAADDAYSFGTFVTKWLIVDLNDVATEEQAAAFATTDDPNKAIVVSPIDGADLDAAGLNNPVKIYVGEGKIFVMAPGTKLGSYVVSSTHSSMQSAVNAVENWTDTPFIKIKQSVTDFALTTSLPDLSLYVLTEGKNVTFTYGDVAPGYDVEETEAANPKGLMKYQLVPQTKTVTFTPGEGGSFPTTIVTDKDGNVVVTGTYGETFAPPAENPYTKGKAFIGWYDDDDHRYGDKKLPGEETDPLPFVFPASNLTLHAVYGEAVASLKDNAGNIFNYATVEEAVTALNENSSWFTVNPFVTVLVDAEYELPVGATLSVSDDSLDYLTLTAPEGVVLYADGMSQSTPYDEVKYFEPTKVEDEKGIVPDYWTVSYSDCVAQVMTQKYNVITTHEGTEEMIPSGNPVYTPFMTFTTAANYAIGASTETTECVVMLMAEPEEYQLAIGKTLLIVPGEFGVDNVVPAEDAKLVIHTVGDTTEIKCVKVVPVVTFNFNFEGAPAPVDVDYNSEFQIPDTSKMRPGWAVDDNDWYLFANPAPNDRPVDFKEITEDTVVYAKWHPIATVTALFYYGDVEPEPLNGNAGATITAEDRTKIVNALLEKAGDEGKYDLNTWYSDKTLETQILFPQKLPLDTTSDAKYYAKGTPRTYNISYDLADGAYFNDDASRYPTSYSYGDKFVVPDPVRADKDGISYAFKQWVDQDGKTYPGGLEEGGLRFEGKEMGNKQYVAEWTPSKYSYKFTGVNRDGQVVVYSSGLYSDGKDDPKTIAIPAAPTMDGMEFNGWTYTYKDNHGETQTVNIGKYTTTIDVADIQPIQDLTVVASFVGLQATITFKDGDTELGKYEDWDTSKEFTSSDVPSDVLANLAQCKKEGYSYDSKNPWTVSLPTYFNGHTIVEVNWIKNSVVKFVYEGAVIHEEEVIPGSTLTYTGTIKKDGKDCGWVDDAGNVYVAKKTVIKADTIFTATWSNTYTITWKNYNGDVLATSAVNPGVVPTYTGATPTKEGELFKGWNPEVKAATADATYTAVFEPHNEVYTSTMTIGDSFDIYFKVKSIPETADLDKYSVEADGVVIAAEGEVKLGEGIFVTSRAAKELADEVSIVVKYDGQAIATKNYSVRTYAEALKTKYSTDANLISLLDAMLDYGSYAQLHWSYNTSDLANRGSFVDHKKLPDFDNVKYKTTKDGSADGITGVGVALFTVSKTEFEVRFSHTSEASLANYKFTANGNSVKATDDGSKFIVKIKGIAAKDLLKSIPVTVTDNAGSTLSVNANPVSYLGALYKNYKDSDPNMANLACSIFWYADAADTYFNPPANN